MKDKRSLECLSDCVSHVLHWFLSNKLQLNADKSAALIYGTAQIMLGTRPGRAYWSTALACSPLTKRDCPV
jgi:hypothetical protein